MNVTAFFSLPEPIRNAEKAFNKSEIISIAKELNINVSSPVPPVRVLMVLIHNDLADAGIPKADDCSDLLDDYLFEAGYLDDAGYVVESVLKAVEADFEDEESENELEVDQEVITKEDLPACFSFADERDAPCRRCKVFELCMEERKRRRPPCFGLRFSEHAEECVMCTEHAECRKATDAK